MRIRTSCEATSSVVSRSAIKARACLDGQAACTVVKKGGGRVLELDEYKMELAKYKASLAEARDSL